MLRKVAVPGQRPEKFRPDREESKYDIIFSYLFYDALVLSGAKARAIYRIKETFECAFLALFHVNSIS